MHARLPESNDSYLTTGQLLAFGASGNYMIWYVFLAHAEMSARLNEYIQKLGIHDYVKQIDIGYTFIDVDLW